MNRPVPTAATIMNVLESMPRILSSLVGSGSLPPVFLSASGVSALPPWPEPVGDGTLSAGGGGAIPRSLIHWRTEVMALAAV